MYSYLYLFLIPVYIHPSLLFVTCSVHPGDLSMPGHKDIFNNHVIFQQGEVLKCTIIGLFSIFCCWNNAAGTDCTNVTFFTHIHLQDKFREVGLRNYMAQGPSVLPFYEQSVHGLCSCFYGVVGPKLLEPLYQGRFSHGLICYRFFPRLLLACRLCLIFFVWFSLVW